MGGACSETASDDKEYRIPPGEEYKHCKCTVRAPHQLSILEVPQNCDYCHIVKKFSCVKTRNRCEKY
jgi:hypothetical protein